MSEANMHYYRAYLAFRDAAEYALTKYLEAERGDPHKHYAQKAAERALEGMSALHLEDKPSISAPRREYA